MTSRWEGVPLDIIRQQFEYLRNPEEIQALCKDPYIFDKLCQDENGGIWEYLYRRDLSDEIKVQKNSTLKRTYLNAKLELNNIGKVPRTSELEKSWGASIKYKDLDTKDADTFYFAIDNRYEKILPSINFFNIPEQGVRRALETATFKCQFETVKYMLENIDKLPKFIIPNMPNLLMEIATRYNCSSIIDYIINNR